MDKSYEPKLPVLSGQEAFNELSDYFLGEGWYVVDPLCTSQVNAIAVEEIKQRYKGRKREDKIFKFGNFELKIKGKNRW